MPTNQRQQEGFYEGSLHVNVGGEQTGPTMNDTLLAGSNGFVAPENEEQYHSIAPTDLASGLRIAGKAGFGPDAIKPPLWDPDSGKDAPPPFKGGNPSFTQRHEYNDALGNGEVVGPQEYSEQFMANLWALSRKNAQGNAEDNLPQAEQKQFALMTHAAKGLASQLPTNEALTDYAIAIAQAHQLPHEAIRFIRDNLGARWADTGRPLEDIYNETRLDDRLAYQMASPPQEVQTEPWPKALPTMSPQAEHAMYAVPSDVEEALALGKSTAAVLKTFGQAAYGIMESFQPDVYLKDEEKLMSGQMDRHELAGFILKHVLPARGAPKVNALDLKLRKSGLEPGETVAKVFQTEQSELLSVTTTDGRTFNTQEKLKPGDTVPRTILDDFHAANEKVDDGLWRRLLTELDEFNEHPIDFTPGAEPHMRAGSALSAATLRSLLKDESGRVSKWTDKNWWQNERQAENIIRDERGMNDRIIAASKRMLEPYIKELNKLMPEHEKFLSQVQDWVKAGRPPGTFPPLSRIQEITNYIEGRSQVTSGATHIHSQIEVRPNPAGGFDVETPLEGIQYASTQAEVDKIVSRYTRLSPEEALRYDTATGRNYSEDWRNNKVDPVAAQQAQSVLPPHLRPYQPFADTLKLLNDEARADLKALDAAGMTKVKEYIDDYFRHRFVNPHDLKNMKGPWSAGSKSATMERDAPTMLDAIRAGAIPKNPHPVANAIEGITGLQKYIANLRVIEQGLKNGQVVRLSPAGVPEGWGQLAGRTGSNYFAHPGYADAYNNWMDRGFYKTTTAGEVYDTALKISNSMLGMKLALSAYHAMDIAEEAVTTGLSQAIGHVKAGELGRALVQMGLSAGVAPKIVAGVVRGDKYVKAYMDPMGAAAGKYGTDADLIANYWTRAGGGVPGRVAMDYGQQSMDVSKVREGYLKTIRTWGLKDGIKQIGREIGHDFRTPGEPAWKTAVMNATGLRLVKSVVTEFNRTEQSLMSPLFDVAIPRLKMSAFADEMQAWLRRNPTAATADKLQFARQTVNSIDYRYGMLNQDNLFWHRATKQALNLVTVSLGWEYGSLAAMSRGGADLARANLSSASARWLIAYPLSMMYLNELYGYMVHGTFTDPSDYIKNPMHMFLFSTGGKTPEGMPEWGQRPGYGKEPLQMWKDFQMAPGGNSVFGLPMRVSNAAIAYMGGKQNPATQLAMSALTGRDWMDNKIRLNERDPDLGPIPNWILPEGWNAWQKHIWHNSIEPVAWGQEAQRLRNTGLYHWETGFMGMRPAPAYYQDPERTMKGKAIGEEIERKRQEGTKKRMNQRLETPDPTIPAPGRSGGRKKGRGF